MLAATAVLFLTSLQALVVARAVSAVHRKPLIQHTRRWNANERRNENWFERQKNAFVRKRENTEKKKKKKKLPKQGKWTTKAIRCLCGDVMPRLRVVVVTNEKAILDTSKNRYSMLDVIFSRSVFFTWEIQFSTFSRSLTYAWNKMTQNAHTHTHSQSSPLHPVALYQIV